MSQPPKHRGVIVPLVTPVTAAGEIDEAATKRLVKHCADGGVHVFVLGTTGEAASVAAAKRVRVVKAAVEAAAGRVKVYAGIGDNCPEQSVAAGNEYLRLGADAVVAHLPAYYSLRPAEMKSFFTLLASQIQGGLMLYNIPSTTHMSLPIDVADELSHLPNVIGFKDSENAPGRPEETARRLGGRPNFSIFMGAAVLSAKAMKLGFDGLVPSSGNFVPHLWTELYNEALAGHWEKVEALQLRLNSVAQVFQKDRTLGESLGALKVMLETLGICGPAVLPPLRTLDAEARKLVQRDLAALNPA
ncbi:MAG: dihydrodipicolinate synthase family protein [Nibricoccus sp.]